MFKELSKEIRTIIDLSLIMECSVSDQVVMLGSCFDVKLG